MTFLFDANVWFELLLETEAAPTIRRLIEAAGSRRIMTTDFTLHAIGVVLSRDRPDLLRSLIEDWITWSIAVTHISPAHMPAVLDIKARHQLDFDDAMQYFAASVSRRASSHSIPTSTARQQAD